MPYDPEADFVILKTVEGALDASWERAGKWIACRAGCSECCSVLFPITMQDAARLHRGLLAADEATRTDIQERAQALWKRIAFDFPGDSESGLFHANSEWQEWFLTRHKGHPCPVVDPENGACRLYEHRPVACRLYGHLIQIGEEKQTICRLCFQNASEEEIEKSRVRLEVEDVNQTTLDAGETLIVRVLTASEWPPSSSPAAF